MTVWAFKLWVAVALLTFWMGVWELVAWIR